MAAHWTQGYVSELAYPHDYIAELNPARMQLPFLAAGLAPPVVGSACELGFGQGLSVNIHAAASGVEWHGNDFNPDQALGARALAAASGAKAALTDESFADFFARTDLPDFDFIGMHGVWSWVSDENRALIADFIRRKLKPGGVVYVGYNTQPGWATTIPVRSLATQHVQRMAGPGQGLKSRIDGALGFIGELAATQPAFMRDNPSVTPWIETLRGQDVNYLAHEYFNASWRPMSFAEMASALVPAGLEFACSAHVEVERTILSSAQQSLVAGIADPVMRELVRDFCVNQQFRKDYWVKGARRLDADAQAQALRASRVALVRPLAEVAFATTTARGTIELAQPVFGPLLDLLADHRARTLAQIEESLPGMPLSQLVESLMLLTAKGDVAPVQPDAVAVLAKPQADRLNMHLLNKAVGSSDVAHLACPMTGGAVALNRVEQLLLYASLDLSRKPSDLAPLVWQVLGSQGQRMLRDGKPLEREADNLAELDRVASSFVRRLPMLRALGVFPNVVRA